MTSAMFHYQQRPELKSVEDYQEEDAPPGMTLWAVSALVPVLLPKCYFTFQSSPEKSNQDFFFPHLCSSLPPPAVTCQQIHR